MELETPRLALGKKAQDGGRVKAAPEREEAAEAGLAQNRKASKASSVGVPVRARH